MSVQEIADVCGARDWDLHLERAGALARDRSGADEDAPLWVASVSRNDFALEAQGRTPAAAIERLAIEITRFGTPPRPRPTRAAAR